VSEAVSPGGDCVEQLYRKLERDAGEAGYQLNPDREMTLDLVRGLAANRSRYSYMLCPCRLSGGGRAADLDIICPCDYRDADLDEYDTCY